MPATTTTTIGSVCPKCGTMGKFGKHSCCGHGGSWFKNCGSTGNAKLDHTWYEGIQACKASLEQSKLGLGQPQQNPDQQKRKHPSNDFGVVKSNSVFTAPQTFKFTLVNPLTRIPRAMPMITPVYTRANASIKQPIRLSIDTSMTDSAQRPDITSITYSNDTANSISTSAEVAMTASTSATTPILTLTITATNTLISTFANTSMSTPTRTPMNNISTHILPPAVTHSSSSLSIITQVEALLKTFVHTSVLLIIAF